MASAWMEQIKSAVTQRGEDFVVKFSQRALDAIESVEKVEGLLARAPATLKDWREKATEQFESLAHMVRPEEKVEGEAWAADLTQSQAKPSQAQPSQARRATDVAPRGLTVETPTQDLPLHAAEEASRASNRAPASGRKVAPAPVSAKQSRRPRKSGFKAKRGQKHSHNR